MLSKEVFPFFIILMKLEKAADIEVFPTVFYYLVAYICKIFMSEAAKPQVGVLRRQQETFAFFAAIAFVNSFHLRQENNAQL